MLSDEELGEADAALMAWFESQDIDVADSVQIMLRVLGYSIAAVACGDRNRGEACRTAIAEAVLEMPI